MRLVVLADGRLVLYVERGGRTLLSWTEDPDVLGPATLALAHAVREGALGRLTVERAERHRRLRVPACARTAGRWVSTQLHGAFAFESNCRTTEPHSGTATEP